MLFVSYAVNYSSPFCAAPGADTDLLCSSSPWTLLSQRDRSFGRNPSGIEVLARQCHGARPRGGHEGGILAGDAQMTNLTLLHPLLRVGRPRGEEQGPPGKGWGAPICSQRSGERRFWAAPWKAAGTATFSSSGRTRFPRPCRSLPGHLPIPSFANSLLGLFR